MIGSPQNIIDEDPVTEPQNINFDDI